jgi:antitoxin HicB
MRYPVRLTKDDNDTFLVTFPDFPEAATFGETREEALARAIDALETAIQGRMSDREDIPPPSGIRGPFVTLPSQTVAKILLYRTMRRDQVTRAELGRRLRWHRPQVDRLFDFRHASRLDQLDAAFGALGARLEVAVAREGEAGARRMPVARIREISHRKRARPSARTV